MKSIYANSAFLTLLLLTIGEFLGITLEFIPFMTGTDFAATATLYLEFIGIWIVLLLYMRFTKKNRPLLKAVGRQSCSAEDFCIRDCG